MRVGMGGAGGRVGRAEDLYIFDLLRAMVVFPGPIKSEVACLHPFF